MALTVFEPSVPGLPPDACLWCGGKDWRNLDLRVELPFRWDTKPQRGGTVVKALEAIPVTCADCGGILLLMAPGPRGGP
jgi:hypothetical protein